MTSKSLIYLYLQFSIRSFSKTYHWAELNRLKISIQVKRVISYVSNDSRLQIFLRPWCCQKCKASVLYYEEAALRTIQYVEDSFGLDVVERKKLSIGPHVL
jgi:hypothetical protein